MKLKYEKLEKTINQEYLENHFGDYSRNPLAWLDTGEYLFINNHLESGLGYLDTNSSVYEELEASVRDLYTRKGMEVLFCTIKQNEVLATLLNENGSLKIISMTKIDPALKMLELFLSDLNILNDKI